MELLYGGELTVRGSGQQGVVRGQLLARPVAGAIDSPRPVLMRAKSNTHTQLTALAWMTIDFDCDLHYEVIQASSNKIH